MENHQKKNTLTKEEKLIVVLFSIAGAILILGIGYLIATVFIEFPWEKNAPTVTPEEFDARLSNIVNKTFLFTGIVGGVLIAFNLMRFIRNKLVKHATQNAKIGVIGGSILLTASYLAYFLTNYEPGYSSGESDGSIAIILMLSVVAANLVVQKKNKFNR